MPETMLVNAAVTTGLPYQTGELNSFLTRVTSKRIAYISKRQRNLRIEAVLVATLKSTQSEIDRRRSLRKRRWSALKPEWLRTVQLADDVTSGVGGGDGQLYDDVESREWVTESDGQWGFGSGGASAAKKASCVLQEDLFNLSDFFRELDNATRVLNSGAS